MSHQSPVFCTLLENQKRLGHFDLHRSASLHELCAIIRCEFLQSSRDFVLQTGHGEEISSDRDLASLLRLPVRSVRFFVNPARDEEKCAGLRRSMASSNPLPLPRNSYQDLCRRCWKGIEGVRFQCLHCPSPFNLCSTCESSLCRKGFHPRTHVFAK